MAPSTETQTEAVDAAEHVSHNNGHIEMTEYTLAAKVFYHADASGRRHQYNRGDTIQLNAEQARRLLRCGGVVPIGTTLPPEPATVSYGDAEEIPWDAQSRKMIERDIAEGRLRPSSGPHLVVK